MFNPPGSRLTALVFCCTAFSIIGARADAQLPEVTASQSQKIRLVPRITEVKSPGGAEDGAAKLRPLQGFTIEGSLFHDLASKNRITIVRPATSWSVAFQVAEFAPLTATPTTLTAKLPNIEDGTYILRVTVEGSDPSNGVAVKVDMDAGRLASRHITSVTPDSAKRGQSILLTGSFGESSLVFLDPTTAAGEPLSFAPSHASSDKITFKLPAAVSLGGYRISVAPSASAKRTNALRLRVVDDKDATYGASITKIRCVTESADGMGSDEIYAVAVSFILDGNGLASPEEMGTNVFNNVDAGESLELQYPFGVRTIKGAPGSDHLILIGLEEYDSSEGDEPEDKRGPTVVKGIARRISDVSRGKQLSRDKLTLYAATAMAMELAKRSSRAGVLTTSDELLGVRELRLTDAEMQKVAQLDGAPLTKQLVFRGDGSHYVMDVQVRLIN